MAATFPGGVKAFTTKQNYVDAPDAAHINDLQRKSQQLRQNSSKAAARRSTITP